MENNNKRSEKFWNMESILKKHARGYSDWEGMASGHGLKKMVRKALKTVTYKQDDKEIRQVVGDLLMHYAYECRDQTDIEPSEEVLLELAYVLYNVVTTKEWMKSGTKW